MIPPPPVVPLTVSSVIFSRYFVEIKIVVCTLKPLDVVLKRCDWKQVSSLLFTCDFRQRNAFVLFLFVYSSYKCNALPCNMKRSKGNSTLKNDRPFSSFTVIFQQVLEHNKIYILL
jgi:hypothetical protein